MTMGQKLLLLFVTLYFSTFSTSLFAAKECDITIMAHNTNATPIFLNFGKHIEVKLSWTLWTSKRITCKDGEHDKKLEQGQSLTMSCTIKAQCSRRKKVRIFYYTERGRSGYIYFPNKNNYSRETKLDAEDVGKLLNK